MIPNPVPALRAQLIREVQLLTEGWDTPELMSKLRTSESRVSKLRRGKGADMSLVRLIQVAAQLGAEVTLTVTERRHSGGAGRKA